MLRTVGIFVVAGLFCCTAWGQEDFEDAKKSESQTKTEGVCPVLPKGHAAAKSSDHYVQFSEIVANEGFTEQLKSYAMVKLGAAQDQPGMISWSLLTDPENKNKFTVVEIWKSFESLENFRETAIYKKVHGPEQLAKMEDWVGSFETKAMNTASHWSLAAAGPVPSGDLEMSSVSVASPYLLANCALSGRPLDVKGSRTMVEVEGREIGTCCGGCAKFLQKNPAKYLKAVDAAHADQQRPIYPLKTCVVSGEALQADATIEVMVGNRLFLTCCDGCAEAIKADPSKYVAILDKAAREQQSANYALEVCPISGKAATGDAVVEKMVGGRLVRLCCEGCKAAFEKDKVGVVAKVDAALAKQRGK